MCCTRKWLWPGARHLSFPDHHSAPFGEAPDNACAFQGLSPEVYEQVQVNAAGTGSEQSSGASEPHALRPPAVTYIPRAFAVSYNRLG